MIDWNGVYPAVTTKFTQDDELDLKSFEHNIMCQIKAGIHGIILGGTLGESSTLNDEEKETLIKATVEMVNGKVPVVMNIAEQSTKKAIKAVEAATKCGVKGLMLLPPMRYYADDRETVNYFKEVAGSTDLPIMLYNNPIDYKILITLDMFEELEVCSNITAVKDSTRQLSNVTKMINRFGDRFKVLTGVDPLAFESLALGAHGWVAGLVCAFPKETVAIYELIQQGRYEEALVIYRWFYDLLELDISPRLVQYIKLAEVATGLGTENVRSPRLPIVGKDRERVLKIIDDSLKIRPAIPNLDQISV
jgi:4-hydroxy-tetrahydrodipicolinate synthase